MMETCETTAGRRTGEWSGEWTAAWERGWRGSAARDAGGPSEWCDAYPPTGERVAALPMGERAAGGSRAWAAGSVAFVVFWSLTYLLRQPGVGAVASRPFSLLGDFALEGACLALAWLALVVIACLAVLRGAIVFSPDR
jgi:hypothetical protein